MDKIFEYIEQDMKVMLAVAALCAVIAILALWKVVADLRRDSRAAAAAKTNGSSPTNP